MTNDEYITWMCNPDNAYNCDACPERSIHCNDCGLPCGQQNCWVILHTDSDSDPNAEPDS